MPKWFWGPSLEAALSVLSFAKDATTIPGPFFLFQMFWFIQKEVLLEVLVLLFFQNNRPKGQLS
jgi:hypothetical protein